MPRDRASRSRRRRRNVTGDVGNRHQSGTAVGTVGGNGVVEIAGRLAIDGHKRQVAQVLTAGQLGFGHLGWNGRSRRQHLGRESVGQAEAFGGDADFHGRIVACSEHLDHSGRGRLRPPWVGLDTCRHHLAGARAPSPPRGIKKLSRNCGSTGTSLATS